MEIINLTQLREKRKEKTAKEGSMEKWHLNQEALEDPHQ